MTNDELTIELQRAYRCIQGMHHALQRARVEFPANGYHALTIGAAKRYIYESQLDGSEYFIGKDANVLQDALRLGTEGAP